ncbi:MAG: XRE family transcriptional regulator [Thermotaleaceae bacterium]
MLGKRIREIRKHKKISLVEMGEKTGFSSSYLSQIERDLISPSLSSLRKIAQILEVPLYEFLKEDENKEVLIKKNQRVKLELPDSDITYEFLTPTRLQGDAPNMEIIYMKLKPHSWSSEGPSYHAADECIFVLRGEVEIHLGDKVYLLVEGDSLYIREKIPHRIYNKSNIMAEVMSCISPPVY